MLLADGVAVVLIVLFPGDCARVLFDVGLVSVGVTFVTDRVALVLSVLVVGDCVT